VQDVSYPFLIQANYRAGFFTHYAGEGTVKSCRVSYNGRTADMCLCRTKAEFSEENGVRTLTLEPVEMELKDLKVTIQSIFRFKEGSGAVETERRVLKTSIPGAKVEIDEYTTACYGYTEYPEDMTVITLATDKENLKYEYKDRSIEGSAFASAVIPPINTKVSVCAENASSYAREGYAFSPMFSLGVKKEIGEGECFKSWLKLEKEN